MTRARARELCRYVRHYQAKNGFAPNRASGQRGFPQQKAA